MLFSYKKLICQSRKLFQLIFTIILTSCVISTAQAQSDFFLQQIMINTRDIRSLTIGIERATSIIQNTTNLILERVNMLPAVLEKLGEFIAAWLDEDDSDTTANMVTPFSNMGELLEKNMTDQLAMQTQLNTDLLGKIDAKTLPNANDLVYSSLLGSFYFPKDPRGKPPQINPQYNYIKNAAAITIPHVIPGSGWGGPKEDQERYRNYYDTVMAVSSFNGFVLSNQYVDGNQFNTLQQSLIKQATDSDKWFAQIASEKIGYVLRQLLIYQSQVFVMLTQMVQLQKQAVAAQVMTNSLIISNSLSTEGLLLNRAQGVRPT